MFLTITDTKVQEIVQPILDICGAVVPVLLVLVGAVGAIWCILLGVKFAKADDPQEHEKAKNSLKYAIIGFVLIFVLLVMLKIGTRVLTDYYTEAIRANQ